MTHQNHVGGVLDEAEILEVFLAAIGHLSAAERVVELVWRRMGVLRVERREPVRSEVGKVHHLHRARRLSSEQVPLLINAVKLRAP